MNLNFFNSTGGVRYHLRALIHRKKWEPFCDFVEAWLLDWKKSPKMTSVSTLVLIGPNAGYTLSPSFISLFSNVIVVEPDPLAFALFEARFQARARWVHQDYFDLKSKDPNAEKLKNLFAAYPNSAFLFCNVLGQLPVLLRDKKNVNVEAYMKKLGQVLAESAVRHNMASYHDRYSRNLKNADEMIDHMTGDLFLFASDKKEFPWRLSKKIEHQIEFVRA
jgi:hypothetical protein